MTLSKLLRAACKAAYLHRGKQQQNKRIIRTMQYNHILKSSVFPDPKANEFLKYSFCKENHRHKLSFKLSKSAEQKVDGMCKYTEHLDRQDLCRISLYPEQQIKQWPGYKYLHIYSLFAGKQEKTSPESRHFCDLCISINLTTITGPYLSISLFVSI